MGVSEYVYYIKSRRGLKQVIDGNKVIVSWLSGGIRGVFPGAVVIVAACRQGISCRPRPPYYLSVCILKTVDLKAH